MQGYQADSPRQDAQRPRSCPRCGGSNLIEAECPFGPHQTRLVCSDCQKHLWFLPAPWNLERARKFVLPFGQYKGRSVAEVADTPAGRGYLRWVAENVQGNAGRAAAAMLESLPPKGGRA